MKAASVRSVAICFLNSFANPDHERIVGKALGQLLPDVFISLSSDVAPQIREFPRASTTTVNAYTMPITQPYLRSLSARLTAEAVPNPPLIMLSSGGVVGAETAGRSPVRMIESGPAAGALGGLSLRRSAGDRPADVFRYGRHHRQSLPDRTRPAADYRPVRGRPPLSIQAKAAACR